MSFIVCIRDSFHSVSCHIYVDDFTAPPKIFHLTFILTGLQHGFLKSILILGRESTPLLPPESIFPWDRSVLQLLYSSAFAISLMVRSNLIIHFLLLFSAILQSQKKLETFLGSCWEPGFQQTLEISVVTWGLCFWKISSHFVYLRIRSFHASGLAMSLLHFPFLIYFAGLISQLLKSFVTDCLLSLMPRPPFFHSNGYNRPHGWPS